MITRKTLKLFGCHEAAVEQFAREAGLEIENATIFKKDDWVIVCPTNDNYADASITGWIGQVTLAGEIITEVTFHGRPMPPSMAASIKRGQIYTCNLKKYIP